MSHKKQKFSKTNSLSFDSSVISVNFVISIVFWNSNFRNYGFRTEKSELDNINIISMQISISFTDLSLVVLRFGRSGSIYIS